MPQIHSTSLNTFQSKDNEQLLSGLKLDQEENDWKDLASGIAARGG